MLTVGEVDHARSGKARDQGKRNCGVIAGLLLSMTSSNAATLTTMIIEFLGSLRREQSFAVAEDASRNSAA